MYASLKCNSEMQNDMFVIRDRYFKFMCIDVYGCIWMYMDVYSYMHDYDEES